jgi:shikimate kinase
MGDGLGLIHNRVRRCEKENGKTRVKRWVMRIFLTGVACVGKTTIGAKLASLLGHQFFDLDLEIEKFFDTSIERLRDRYLTQHSFRAEAARALTHLLALDRSADLVVALPPSGLIGGYWKVVKNVPKCTIVVLQDTPENILKRITFYDIDSRRIQKKLTDREKLFYLREIKRDITYFRRGYQRAHIAVDIAGCCPYEAALRIKERIIR